MLAGVDLRWNQELRSSVSAESQVSWRNFYNDPPLPTHKQLALSVLLDEGVPLSVLISALEDAGVFPNGILQAVADKAVEEYVAAELEWEEKGPPFIDPNKVPQQTEFERTVGEWLAEAIVDRYTRR
jgi:hypothetical protein